MGEGDVDVAAPTLEWRGDVLIAVGMTFACDVDVASPFEVGWHRF